MKKLISKIALLLSILLVTSFFISCVPTSQGPGPVDPERPPESELEDTSYQLVSNGATQYTIVVPDVEDRRIIEAVNELNSLFAMATGVSMPQITESEAVYSDSAKYIVLGRCEELIAQAEIDVDFKELGYSGYILKTVGENLFIIGGNQYGTYYGVLEFLRQNFNFEEYSPQEIQIDRKVLNRYLKEFDIKAIPDFDIMMCNSGATRHLNAKHGLRLGFEAWNEIVIYVPNDSGTTSNPWHNFLMFVDPATYNDPNKPETYHPEYFSSNGICLSNPDVYEITLAKLKKLILDNPDMHNITVSQMDHAVWCACADCKADLEHYGSNSGNMVKFMNKLSRGLAADPEFADVDITLWFFGYQKQSRIPPCKTDEFGNFINKDGQQISKYGGDFVPVDSDIILEDNVGAWICTDDFQNYAGFSSPVNQASREQCLGWTYLTDNMGYWGYEMNYGDYFQPLNTFNTMQETFKFYKDTNARFVFSQGEVSWFNASTFTMLKAYIQSKFRWNVDANMGAIIDDYFANQFQIAGDSMKKYFDDLRLVFDYQENVQGRKPGIQDKIQNCGKYWQFGQLMMLQNDVNQAFKDIEHLKETNYVLWEDLYNRIASEELSITYMLVALYPSYFEADVLQGMVDRFVEVCAKNNFNVYCEGYANTIEKLVANGWGKVI